MNKFFLVVTKNLPILQQLRLEEALLRADDRNWCLINCQEDEAIVFGISAKPKEMAYIEQAQQKKISLIRRFTGGGTVVVDHNTLFVTFIGNESIVEPLPKPILHWSFEKYLPFFHPHPFSLKENDFTVGEKKIGGNALYIQKKRWLLHTSFLWDFDEKMDLLTFPKKRPAYRESRCHQEFLLPLKNLFTEKASYLKNLISHLTLELKAELISLDEALRITEKPHRKSTEELFFQ